MRNLLEGLPPEARIRREDPDAPTWGFVEELLAQLIEEVSVLAADKRRKKPREVPRPMQHGKKKARTPAQARQQATDGSNTAGGRTIRGHKAMLAYARERMAVQQRGGTGTTSV